MGNRAIAVVVAVCTIVVLAASSHDIGLTWDEPIYMEAAESYVGWVAELVSAPADALSTREIVAHWELNHEHPPADKLWSGLVWEGARFVFDDVTAHRLGNILVAGLLAALVYLLVAHDTGWLAGVAAVAALFSMPRLFFHAHLATLDLPAATGIFGVCYLFWRDRARSDFRADLYLGVAYGLAMSTKITALVATPMVLGLWMMLFQRRLRTFARLLVMGIVGVVVAVLLWPWLYHDTVSGIQQYGLFMTVDHYRIAQWYLNRSFDRPPWHYVPVLTLAVVPLTTLLLAGLGVVTAVRSRPAFGWLLIGAAIVPMLFLASGKSDVYDGERLWMPTFPFIAALAGIGFGAIANALQRLARHLRQPRLLGPLVGLAGAVAMLPQLAAAGDLYPHLLSYYSEPVGGLPGANRLGLETTYWSDTYDEVLSYLNANGPPGAMVWAESHDVLLYYQHTGQLRADLRVASHHGAEGIVPGVHGYTAAVTDADFVVIQYRQSGFTREVSEFIRTRTPEYRLLRDGVPLMEVYTR